MVCLKYDQTCIINFGEKAKDSNGTIIVNIQFALLFIKVTWPIFLWVAVMSTFVKSKEKTERCSHILKLRSINMNICHCLILLFLSEYHFLGIVFFLFFFFLLFLSVVNYTLILYMFWWFLDLSIACKTGFELVKIFCYLSFFFFIFKYWPNFSNLQSIEKILN